MITLSALYKSARLRSLPLSVSGIFVGSALSKQNLRWEVFIMAILTAISYQIVSDYANDYGDWQKGTDNNQRLGPKRALQSGQMTTSEIKNVIISSVIFSLLCTLTLIWITFNNESFILIIGFLLLGIACLWAGIKYTVGKFAYGYLGLGDVFVFIFFGIVSVLGSYFLQTQNFNWINLLPATTIGLLSVAVLNLNNMRDLTNDKAMHKQTIPVRIGKSMALLYHFTLIIGACISYVIFIFSKINFIPKQEFPLLAIIPLLYHLYFIVKNPTPQRFDSQLKIVAFCTFLFSVLFFIKEIYF